MKKDLNAVRPVRPAWTRHVWAIGLVVWMLGACLPAAQGTLLYQMRYEDGGGANTLTNSGSVGGLATQTGTHLGVFITDTPSGSGKAMDFPNGGGGFDGAALTLPSSTAALPISSVGDEMTIAAWVKWDGAIVDAYPQGIVGKGAYFGTGWWSFGISDTGQLEMGWTEPLGNRIIQDSVGTVSAGQWTFVGVTFKAGLNNPATFYIAGVDAGLVSGIGPGFATAPSNTDPIRLGISSQDGWMPLNGALDDVRLYDYALTADEMYALTVPEPGTALLLALGSGVVVWRSRKKLE